LNFISKHEGFNKYFKNGGYKWNKVKPLQK
jgi:hypothetical protein